ncbi:FtsX-like permease family protein, partial [Candidatus Microgenomates bacterium]|nr:FtsX-like permease family protein [Candidatus Microgenomates bacterium]
PASLEVSAVNVKDLDSLSQVLKNSDIISEVVFQKDIVDTLISWTNAVRKIGLLVFLILALISILIIITALGMKISIRREEIEILRLVGASAWYIRLPFIVEGVLYGLIGSFIAWLLSYGGLLYATPFINSFLFGIPILPISPYTMLLILGMELVTAVLLGAIASFIAVLRYLK